MGIGREMAVPESVAEHGDLVFAGLVLPRREGPAEERRDTEQGEEVRLDGQGGDVVRPALDAEVHVLRPAKQRHVLEGAVLRFPVDEIRSGEGIRAGRRFRLVEAQQLFRVAVRQGPQQDGFDDAENGGVGADSDGQRDGGDDGESRRLPQASRCVAQVLQQRLHELASLI